AQCSSPAYDSSLEETWLAFAVGATLVLLDDETVRLGPDLVPWLNHERITVFCPPPTLLRTTGCEDPANALPLLKLIYVGGEALPQDLADLWSQGRRLENGYGPTECTVTVVRTQIYSGVAVTIGRPVEGHTVRIVDEALGEVAIGCEGELCISGIGLARGYRNRPEITAEKFIVHPKFGRIYRTGDLTRLTPSGDIEYLGRIDGQIKLRGYRVELAAIDALLSQCEGIREAACRVQGQGAAQIIVAHVVALVAGEQPTNSALRAALTLALPIYMVPSKFVAISVVPRTVSGKIDRSKLPVVESTDDRTEPIRPARNIVERAIADAFTHALHHGSEISIDDDFFMTLGGDSLSAVGAICALRKNPATERLSVRDIYEHRTPERLAQRLALTEGLPEMTHSPRIRAGIRADDPKFASVVQAHALLALAIATGAISYVMFFVIIPSSFEILGFGWSIALAPFVACVAILLFGLLAITLTVFAKRILLGKVRAITTPVFSATYLRHWIVQQFARLIPWGLIEGTVIYNSVLRLLGAKIGKRVHIHRGVELRRGGWDLLTIGDDVTLAQE
ncbi:MAG: amino acid adenylation protein, partial [Planctomycetes bacterium]|nr:amino acid adenylation protein [Planctomycetota bacterium]